MDSTSVQYHLIIKPNENVFSDDYSYQCMRKLCQSFRTRKERRKGRGEEPRQSEGREEGTATRTESRGRVCILRRREWQAIL